MKLEMSCERMQKSYYQHLQYFLHKIVYHSCCIIVKCTDNKMNKSTASNEVLKLSSEEFVDTVLCLAEKVFKSQFGIAFPSPLSKTRCMLL